MRRHAGCLPGLLKPDAFGLHSVSNALKRSSRDRHRILTALLEYLVEVGLHDIVGDQNSLRGGLLEALRELFANVFGD